MVMDLSRFLLENLLGYEDVLMSSVKSLAEKENNKVQNSLQTSQQNSRTETVALHLIWYTFPFCVIMHFCAMTFFTWFPVFLHNSPYYNNIF
jgi:hypothetical protein